MKTTKKTFPASAFQMADGGQVAVVNNDGQKKFSGVAYTGGIMPDPWFENRIYDLSTLTAPRQDISMLFEHSNYEIAGHTNKIDIKKDVSVEGIVSSVTDKGKEVSQLMDEGHPWQLSIYAPPQEIQVLSDGETAMVNGMKVAGPIAIFRNAVIKEISFTSTGRDMMTSCHGVNNTDKQIEVKITSNQNTEENTRMSGTPEQKQIFLNTATVQQVKDIRPDLVDQINQTAEQSRIEAVNSERQRCVDILQKAAAFEDVDVSKNALNYIEKGDSAENAESKMKDIVLEKYKNQHNTTPGPNADTAAEDTGNNTAATPEGETFDGKCERIFKNSDKLQKEFGNLNFFKAYCDREGIPDDVK